jgi:hypothetical protein
VEFASYLVARMCHDRSVAALAAARCRAAQVERGQAAGVRAWASAAQAELARAETMAALDRWRLRWLAPAVFLRQAALGDIPVRSSDPGLPASPAGPAPAAPAGRSRGIFVAAQATTAHWQGRQRNHFDSLSSLVDGFRGLLPAGDCSDASDWPLPEAVATVVLRVVKRRQIARHLAFVDVEDIDRPHADATDATEPAPRLQLVLGRVLRSEVGDVAAFGLIKQMRPGICIGVTGSPQRNRGEPDRLSVLELVCRAVEVLQEEANPRGPIPGGQSPRGARARRHLHAHAKAHTDHPPPTEACGRCFLHGTALPLAQLERVPEGETAFSQSAASAVHGLDYDRGLVGEQVWDSAGREGIARGFSACVCMRGLSECTPVKNGKVGLNSCGWF